MASSALAAASQVCPVSHAPWQAGHLDDVAICLLNAVNVVLLQHTPNLAHLMWLVAFGRREDFQSDCKTRCQALY